MKSKEQTRERQRQAKRGRKTSARKKRANSCELQRRRQVRDVQLKEPSQRKQQTDGQTDKQKQQQTGGMRNGNRRKKKKKKKIYQAYKIAKMKNDPTKLLSLSRLFAPVGSLTFLGKWQERKEQRKPQNSQNCTLWSLQVTYFLGGKYY